MKPKKLVIRQIGDDLFRIRNGEIHYSIKTKMSGIIDVVAHFYEHWLHDTKTCPVCADLERKDKKCKR